MNTITTTASNNTTILAIDLGKYKSVACVLDNDTGDFRFTTFETTRAELRKMIGQQWPASLSSRRVSWPTGFTICASNSACAVSW
jgi:hypothetical protein